jgi:hypothetical protein
MVVVAGEGRVRVKAGKAKFHITPLFSRSVM